MVIEDEDYTAQLPQAVLTRATEKPEIPEIIQMPEKIQVEEMPGKIQVEEPVAIETKKEMKIIPESIPTPEEISTNQPKVVVSQS